MNTKQLDNEYVAHSYGRFDVCLAKGKGAALYDEDGKKYIDFTSGIGVNALGIADDEWKAAVIEQLDKVQHTSNLYYTRPCAELAQLLCEKTGMKKVFFGNSGAEANECAIKFARKYSFDKYGEGRKTIITLCDSFHGTAFSVIFEKPFFCIARQAENGGAKRDARICGLLEQLGLSDRFISEVDAETVDLETPIDYTGATEKRKAMAEYAETWLRAALS